MHFKRQLNENQLNALKRLNLPKMTVEIGQAEQL